MTKPKLKKIINDAHDIEEDHPDACVYYIQYDPDMSQIMLTIKSNRPMTPEEYVLAVADFAETIKEDPAHLFVEEVDTIDGYH